MIIPSGSNFGHPVFTIGIIRFSSFCVSESTTANGINSYEKHKHGDSENREFVPIPSYIFKHTSFARITLIAEQIGGIVPPVAIRVLCHHHCCHVVSASSWWFTTSRLYWRHISLHVIKRGPRGKLFTSFRPQNTASDCVPIARILYSLLQPW
ncbi:hypothetical protein V8G54_029657 [Vigna mungo]|uniref:Uncharacterized protein n=1 Tax=Vigna mungo TaxID=3915 RepID=A0AAQ3MUX6_VIGMU